LTNWIDLLPEVPGDPGTVRQFARRLGGAAETLDGHGNRLRSLVGSLVGVSWQSPAADQFASLSNAIAGDLPAAGQSYRDAGGVLSQYASALEQAQQVRATAQQQLDQAKVEAGVVNVALPVFSGVEDFNPTVRQAHQQAEEARQYVKQMAAAARAALEALAGRPVHLPRPAPKGAASAGRWYDRAVGFGQDFGEGLYEGFKAQAMFGWNVSAGHLMVDPKGYLQFLQEQGDAGEFAGKHPEEFGKSLIDWNYWATGHPGRASGELSAWVATAAALSFADASFAGDPAVVEIASTRAPIRLPSSKSWGTSATLEQHFIDHGADFGATSEDEYAIQASAFLQVSQVQGLPSKIDSGGVIRIYNPTANIFGAFNADGTTKTLFKPDPSVHGYRTNWDYWLAQRERGQ
jgi:uncharacterized protein YukE